jgi:hypothetical protein
MKPLRLSLTLIALAACAQQPRIVNAKLETRALAGALDKEIRSVAGPAWIGYSVPAVSGDHGMGCACDLEGGRTESRSVSLESRDLAVLFRVENNAVGKIRTTSTDCELNAGGLPFVWLTGVRPPDSVRFLASFAEASETRFVDSAVSAIALHADAEADRVLERFIAVTQPERLREKTSFWLGAARGKSGYELLRRMLKDDPSQHVRDKVVFALYVSKEPDAVDALIGAARSDSSSHVRGQALFWLAQKAGKKAQEAIASAIENDPETDVKRRAVFALSQLPHREGVPLLIQVARTNRNPAVRKQAMFWLGQSNDPRALQFFEEVLKH